ncbi:MAG TPA: serine--tRNA ligase [Candidatus Azoamicus sp. OHIO1]
MIDLNLLRKNSDFVVKNYFKRGYTYSSDIFNDLDAKIKKLKVDVYKLRFEYKKKSKLIGSISSNNKIFDMSINNDKLMKNLFNEVKVLKKDILDKENSLFLLESEFKNFLLTLPNLLHESVPFGISEADNLEIRKYKSLSKNFLFSEDLFNDEFHVCKKYVDFITASFLSGSGFVVLKRGIAQLHRALGNYMLDVHINDNGYEEIYSPLMVNSKSLYATGHFPKFYDDQFKIDGIDLWLIPTAEVVLANLVSNRVLQDNLLPLKYVSKTPCFRKEKSSYGKKVQGLIRQYQFDKVELVQIVDPYKSYLALENLVLDVEKILKGLGLSYRVICLCSSDTGFSSSKTYDLEVWFSKKKEYIEVSSCSNTESFQSRRMNAKYKSISKNICEYVHILNGSGVAIGRILSAVMENYLDNKGRLIIPDVLIKYMNGAEVIE